MGRWLALARSDADEKNPKTPVCGTDETDKTCVRGVLSVSSVHQTSVSEKFSEPAETDSGGFVSFVSAAKGTFAENFPESAPSPEPVTRPPVVEPGAAPEPRRDISASIGPAYRNDPLAGAEEDLERLAAEVKDKLAAMAAENERRRDWHAKPVDGWREGRLTIRSAMTGEETAVHLSRGRTRH